MKVEVEQVKDKAQHIVDEIAVEKAVAEEKLEAAKPALEEAESALQVMRYFMYSLAFIIVIIIIIYIIIIKAITIIIP